MWRDWPVGTVVIGTYCAYMEELDRTNPVPDYQVKISELETAWRFWERIEAMYLRSVSIGGATGLQIDAVVDDSKDLPTSKGVPLFPLPNGWFGLFSVDKSRIIVLEGRNKPALIFIESRLNDFEEFTEKANKVLETVEWQDNTLN